MKLKHSKEWFSRHIDAEGTSEIGAGISPWSPPHTGSAKQVLPRLVILGIPSGKKLKAVRGRRKGVAADKILSQG